MKRWPTKTLGEVCDVRIGRTPRRDEPRFWGGDAVWVTIRELNGGEITSSKEMISEAAVRECMPDPVPVGTLLFSFKLSIGKMAVAGCPLYTNEAIAALPIRDPAKLSRDFLRYALLAESHEGTANTAVLGKVLNKEKVQQLPISVPPLAEQERIVKVLYKADELRKLRTQANRRAADLIPALFHDIFGDTISNPKGWPAFAMSDISETTQGVQIPRSEQIEQEKPGYKRYLYITDFLHDESPKFVVGAFQSKEVSEHDLVVANTGSPGRVFLGKAGVLSNNLFKVSFDTSKILQLYLYNFLSLKTFQEHLKGQMKQGIQSHLGHKTFGAQQLMIPPMPLQKEFAARVAEIRELEAEQATSRRRLDDLFQSVLHQAFRGEL